MKRLFLILALLLTTSLCSLALDEEVNKSEKEPISEEVILLPVPSDSEDATNGTNSGEHKVILEPEETPKEPEFNPYSKETLKGIITKDYDIKSPEGMFKEQLKFRSKRGIIKEAGAQFNFQSNFSETIGNESNLKFKPSLINIGFKGKFKSGRDGFNFLFDTTPDIEENFFHRLVLDAWVETVRIPHHTLMFGTSRPNVGVEGGQSPYTLPFVSRSQTARTFGNIRKTGLRLKGDYKYIDYDLGGYSSDTWYSEFFPGVETDLWVNFKPLANVSDKFGKLNLGGGYQVGTRNSHDFMVELASVGYEYKNFWMRAEYANADGYNGGGGLSEKKAWGYNVTLAYRLTKKLELLLRYDDFDSNKQKANNNSREYSAGINYYILGQCLRLIFNYVYCQNEASSDSHKIIVGGQLLL